MSTANYSSRTPEYYLSKIESEVLDTLNASQLAQFKQILEEALPKPTPKLVDLRFTVDLIINRFYVVLFIGNDRRRKARRYLPEGAARIGNTIAIVLFLLLANLAISATVILVGYLCKSAIGIDLLPGHFPDLIKRIIGYR